MLDRLENDLRRPWFSEHKTQLAITFCVIIIIILELFVYFWGCSGHCNNCIESCVYYTGWMFRTKTFNNGNCTDLRADAWTWVSYAFSHADWLHLLSNNLVLVLIVLLFVILFPIHFGGPIVFLIIYFTSAAAGALLHGVAHENGLVGSSGAIYGLLGTIVAEMVLNWDTMRSIIIRIMYIVVVIGLGCITLTDFIWTKSETTSYSAHVGGAITGFAVGLLLMNNESVTNAETKARGFFAIAFVGLAIWCIYAYATKEVC